LIATVVAFLPQRIGRFLMASEVNPPVPWPTYEIGPEKHVYALGVVCVNFNYLEFILLSHYFFFLPVAHAFSSLLFGKVQSNRIRLELLQTIAERHIANAAIRENVLHFVSGFELCADNRNTLMHSMYNVGRSEDPNVVSASKWSRSGNLSSYRFNLDEIRRVADEIASFANFGFATAMFAFNQSRAQAGLPGMPWPPTLPEKPPLPKKLEEVPPPTDQEPPLPPQSSRVTFQQ
jgi:hypothetical protein